MGRSLESADRQYWITALTCESPNAQAWRFRGGAANVWSEHIPLPMMYWAPGNTKQNVPKFISVMVPFFNKEGWLSGIAFNDSMHFEVADETIKKWSKCPSENILNPLNHL